jgi:16S rRNA (guanine1207-N2)-methyltransferase
MPQGLFDLAHDTVQCSPLVPGADVLSGWDPGSCSGLTVQAPASTIERRHVLALALRALVPGGALAVFAAKDKGGTRIKSELEAFGCIVEPEHRKHVRIALTSRSEHPIGIDEAIAAGAPRILPDIGLWSQPGLFNWDRIDPGSELLIEHLPQLKGRGADLGCGIGILAHAALAGGACVQMTLIDIDQRALAVAQRNNFVAGVSTLWADVRTAKNLPIGLDFIVTNPPFHDAGEEDRSLGQAFIRRAAEMLRPGGVLWLTANRHLPYEQTLAPLFETVEQIAQAKGYKVYAARKATVSAKAAAGRAEKGASRKVDPRRADFQSRDTANTSPPNIGPLKTGPRKPGPKKADR